MLVMTFSGNDRVSRYLTRPLIVILTSSGSDRDFEY